jgi:hypothetical protein
MPACLFKNSPNDESLQQSLKAVETCNVNSFQWLRKIASSQGNLAQYIKLYVSFFQVFASFVTFNASWPYLLISAMEWIKVTLFLDVLQLPGVSCLWSGVSFKSRLLTYTAGPLVLIAALLLPSVCAHVLGFNTVEKLERWKRLMDSTWRNIMFLLFFIYPVVSLSTLQVFDCRPRGLNLLATDFSEPCPQSTSFLVVWSAIFIAAYPLGIPCFCLISMIRMGVPLVAADLYERGTLSAMMTAYLQSENVQELLKMAARLRALKAGKAAERMQSEYQRQVDQIYSETFLDNGFFRFEQESELCDFVRLLLIHYRVDPFSPVQMKDFKALINNLVKDASLFTDTHGAILTKKEAIQLLLFQWDSQIQDCFSSIKKEIREKSLKGDSSNIKKVQETLCLLRGRQSMLEFASKTKNGHLILSQKIRRLGDRLVADKRIPTPYVEWNTEPALEPALQGPSRQNSAGTAHLEALFAVHPDLPDERLRTGAWAFLFRLVSRRAASEHSDLHTVNQRKTLEGPAIKRMGFFLASYRADFWFWELLEMARK